MFGRKTTCCCLGAAWTRGALVILAAGAFALMALAQGPADEIPPSPFEVKIKDESKQINVEPVLPVDPVQHVQFNAQPNMMINLRVDNKTLHLGTIQTLLNIDGRPMFPGNPPGRLVLINAPLPNKPGQKRKPGVMSVYEIGKVSITQMVEVVATKPRTQGQKRRLDSVLVKYIVDNKDTMPHKVWVRIFMDVFIVNNDGALFAAPNQPGKILDGVWLKGKQVPEYLQFLQMPNLKNPGFVAHMTFNFGHGYEMPSRVLLTRLQGFGLNWELNPFMAMGDSAMGVYWEPAEIRPGSKRMMAYAYGEGIAPKLEGDGQLAVVLGGSFEPGKLFSVAAFVQDPSPGQTLTLELPPGIERVEGKEKQPVPVVDDSGNTMVLWKARVLRAGEFPLRVRSSTGFTATKLISVIPRKGKAAGE
jgi:hypothetical protein